MRLVSLYIFLQVLSLSAVGQCNVLPEEGHLEKFREDFPGTRRINEWYSVEIDTFCLLQVKQWVDDKRQLFFYTADANRFGMIKELSLSELPSPDYWLSGIAHLRQRLYHVANADLPYSIFVLVADNQKFYISGEGLKVQWEAIPLEIQVLTGMLPWK